MSEPDLYPNAMAYGRRPRSQPRWTAARWPGRLAALGAAALALLLPARAAAYTYSKSITIDRSKISVGTCGATLTDFPLLFSVTDPDLAHTSSGGKVTDLQGDDIIFRAEDVATCGGAPPCTLDHEIEKYVNTTGELVAWVRLPSLNTAVAASDTVIYVYYGDSSVTSPTENSNGVWDANHAGVWHLHDDFLDSTSNTNNGTNSGSTDAAGQIANGQSFDGFDDYINVGTMGNFGSTLVDATYEFWIKTTQTTQAVALGTYNDGTTTAVAMQLNTEANGTAAEDKISNHLRDEDNMELEGSADAAAFNDGGWHQVAIVNRGPSNGVEIYLDGSSLTVTILEAQTPDNLVDFAYDLTLGARNLRGTIDRFANAFFDEFRISSTARTACWIGAEFENQNDPGDWGSPGFYSIGVPHPHLVYSTTTAPADKPRARLWDNGASSWRSAAVTASADTGVNWTVSARSVVAREAIVATLSSAPSLDVLRWDDGAWTNDWSLAFAGDATRRGVAVAYEQVSGAALVVYSNGTANPQYRMWNGSSWTAAAPVFASAPGTGNVEWVELASRPYSDQIALVYSDTLDAVHAVIWDGSSWNEAQTEITLTTSGSTIRTYRDVEAAYENSGDLLVAWLDTSGTDGRLYYYTMAAGTTSWVNGGFVSMVNGTAAFIDLAVEPGGDRMVATAVDQDGGTERLGAGIWNGSAWQDTGELDDTFPHWETTSDGPFWAGVGWVGTTGEAVIVVSDETAGQMGWYNWTSGGGWSTGADQTVPGMTGFIRSFDVASKPNADKLLAVFSDQDGDLRSALYDGASWSFSGVLEADLTSAQYKPFALAFPTSSGAYRYYKPITIDRTKIPGGCAGTTLSDFPMLFSATDPDLAHTTSSGDVTDLQGDDIIFKALDDDTCGGTGLAPCTLDHEIEKYVNTTGELVAWVRIPSVNTTGAASDTVIYVYYGNSLVTTPTENPTGVWDASYQGVWHLKEAGTGAAGEFVDSSGTGNHGQGGSGDGAKTPAQTTGGRFGNAQDFDGVTSPQDYIDLGSSATLMPSSVTVSAWAKSEGLGDANAWQDIVGNQDFTNGGYLLFLDPEASGVKWRTHSSGTFDSVDAAVTTSDWHLYTGTFGGSTSRLYVDGVLQGTDPAAAMDPSTKGVAIGDDGVSNDNGWFDGSIDEVRISSTVRSACWIGGEYNNQNNPGDVTNPPGRFYTIGAAVATAVELVSFEARAEDSAVDLMWQTGSEVKNLGFHLYRSLSPAGPYERITTSLIPGLGSSPEGALYGYRDVGLVNGIAYFYQLEDVETTGRTERHGPVSATPQPGATGEPEADAGAPADSEDPTEGARSWIRYGDPEATSLSVVERGEGHVVVELITGGFYALPDEDGGVWLQIPGFEETQQPGAPALPVRLAWLEAVAGQKVKLASVVGRDVVAFDGLRPAVTGEPELWESEDGTLHAGRRRHRAGRAFQAAGLYPEEAAELLGTAFQGEVKKAQLGLSPLRWDRAGGRLLLAQRLRVRVVFAGREKGEEAFGGARGKKARGKKTRLPEGVVARLGVSSAGLYGVGYEALFGSRGRGVSVSELSLSQQGEPVAFHVEPAGRRFGPGSVLYFVSPGADLNPYGPRAVYELSLGNGGVQMPLASAAPSGWTVPYYWQRAEYEQDRLYQPTLLDAPDLWLWDKLLANRTRSYAFTLDALAPTGQPARLSLWLQGGSDYPADPDHHLRVVLNGQTVTETSFDGLKPQALELELWPGLLQDGENLLELTELGDTGAAYSLVFLDRFAVSYPRQLLASGGVLAGRFSESGTAEVLGVGSGTYLLDTTEPEPRWLSGAVFTGQGLSFTAEAGREYWVVSPEALLRPVVSLASPSTLADTANRADYLLLAPREFLTVAEPLLEQRRSQGLEALGVAVEEVYEAFGFGESRPEAIRSFLAHAYHNWELPPRYVLLLGDASYDYKGSLGTGIQNQVPPLLIQDAYMWTVSDPAYVAVNGEDLLPDLALGRLPAQSLEQAQALVQKVLDWENAGFDLSGRAVLVADNSDHAGDFEGDAEQLASSFFAGRDVERVYLSRLGGATRATLYDTFDRGASLMSYLGHGAIAIWASENVFNSWDVPKLAPQPQQPFVLTMNCLNGYFHLPTTSNALAEALVKGQDRGAIGAFAPSSLGVHWAANIYHEALVAELASGRHLRLGDAVLAAQNVYADSGARPELLAVYQLLADPALRIR